jgi:hypothetical protein
MARTAPLSTQESVEQATLEREMSAGQLPSSELMTSPALGEPVQEAIAGLAYSYWLERRGSEQGSAEEDWFRAEREISTRQSPQS